MALIGLRRAACVAVLAMPACVVKLADRNSPLENGGVTGPAADCSKVQVLPVGGPAGDPAIRYIGRYDMRDPARPVFDWSGNYIMARFRGTEVTFGIETPDNDQIYVAVVDDRPPVKITATAGRTAYLVADKLDPSADHQIVLHRNSEALLGPATFTGFNFGPTGTLLPPLKRNRRIEVIGDSITCGYGNEGANATCPFDIEVRPGVKLPVTENNYLAYGSLVGRMLDADVTTLCWSGKGVVENYKENPDEEDRAVTLPQLWHDRTLGSVANDKGGLAWDFTKEEPYQAVVVNLGTNDFARDTLPPVPPGSPKGTLPGDNLPDGTIDRQKFRDGVRDLTVEIRKRRPDAHIFLAVPPMLTDQFPLDNARSDLRSALMSAMQELQDKGDDKVHVIELVEQGVRYGLGCDYHPNLKVHEIMAEQVAGAIRSKLCW